MNYRCKWCGAVRSQRAFDTYQELGWDETNECSDVNNKPHEWLDFDDYWGWRNRFTDYEFEMLKFEYSRS